MFVTASLFANYGSLGSVGFGLIQSSLITIFLIVFFSTGIAVTLFSLLITTLGVSVVVSGCGLLLVYKIYYKTAATDIFPDRQSDTSIPQKVWFVCLGLLAILQNQVDLLFVSHLFPIYEAGLYGVAQRLTLPLLLPLMLTTHLAQPHIGRLRGDNTGPDLSLFCRTLTALLFGVTLAGAIAMIPFRSILLEVIFGTAYIAAKEVLTWKIIGVLALTSTGLAHAVFTMCGRPGLLFAVNIISIVLFSVYCSVAAPATAVAVARIHAFFLLLQSLLLAFMSRYFLQITILPIPSFRYIQTLGYFSR